MYFIYLGNSHTMQRILFDYFRRQTLFLFLRFCYYFFSRLCFLFGDIRHISIQAMVALKHKGTSYRSKYACLINFPIRDAFEHEMLHTLCNLEYLPCFSQVHNLTAHPQPITPTQANVFGRSGEAPT